MKVLILNQAFSPDESATAQYAGDLVECLIARGHGVTVLASNRGYLIPEQRFSRKNVDGKLSIVRVASPALPRRFRILRMIDAFLLNCTLVFRFYFLGKFDCTICLTSPPLLGGVLGLYMPRSKGKLVHWAMDINPDQAIRAGWIQRNGLLARLLLTIQLNFYNRCDQIIALDRFMRHLLIEKGVDEEKIEIVPLWWNEDLLTVSEQDCIRFRESLGIHDRKVVMYAGNHSLCHPLDAMLQAALLLKENQEYVFVFVGGGSRVSEVTDWVTKHCLSNVVQLSHHPRVDLPQLLNSADVHVVACGVSFVGVVHPSKVYPFLALNKPFILLGSEESSVGDLIAKGAVGEVVPADDGQTFLTALERLVTIEAIDMSVLAAEYKGERIVERFVELALAR